eukprot:Skav201899  [mRNA]  locus=scaffold550:999917:1001659:- [translate_table: standard]
MPAREADTFMAEDFSLCSIYSGGTLAGGYGGITSAYSGGTLAGAYGGSSGLAAYSGGTTTGLAAYSPSTSALPGAAYTPGTISGTYSPSSAAYTGAVTGTAYTPGTMSGMAYTPGSLAGGVTTVAGGNYSSAPAYGTGTGSFSIAPANTYGGYYSAGTYSRRLRVWCYSWFTGTINSQNKPRMVWR